MNQVVRSMCTHLPSHSERPTAQLPNWSTGRLGWLAGWLGWLRTGDSRGQCCLGGGPVCRGGIDDGDGPRNGRRVHGSQHRLHTLWQQPPLA
jgi:hypothetical protein